MRKRVMDQFRGLFDKLDKNNDGFITVAELHSEMKKHGILSADAKVQVRFLITSYSFSLHGSKFTHSLSTNLLMDESCFPL